jgi:HD-like signal output (HDOD) protein/CheY-like chemotaxis protein
MFLALARVLDDGHLDSLLAGTGGVDDGNSGGCPAQASDFMKRVLFVDDEPLVLQGLQRMLRPLGGEWDMTFLPGGAEALQFMAGTPVDVVVSDIRMPGMNGAQFLNEVMQRHPQTVRLMLSGHADQDLLLRCVGATHQCLPKPCDVDTLKRTVQRATTLGVSLRNESVKALVGRMDHLPTLPALYLEMVQMLEDPDASVEEVAAIVQRDLGMTAKILKLVNSAFFGLGRPIASPFEGVSYLGIETIKALVLSLHVFSQYEAKRMGGISLEQVWLHSLQTADLAKRLAHFQGVRPKEVDEAFVGGLLHDTGKLVLACNCALEYAEVYRLAQAAHLPLMEIEQKTFTCSHADVGGYLLGLWGLPVPVVEAIAMHHAPGASLDEVFSPLTAVHVADVLSCEGAPQEPEMVRPSLDVDYLRKLALEDNISVWRDALCAEDAFAGPT